MKLEAGRLSVDQHHLEITHAARPADIQFPPSLRPACARDLPDLLQLETHCFEDWQRDSRRTMQASLRHPHREVWILSNDSPPELCAALFLRWNSRRMRLYSLATDPSQRGRGLGSLLVRQALLRTHELGLTELTLEANADQPDLITWYEKSGFAKQALLQDFYTTGKHAWRLTLALSPSSNVHS